MFGAVLSGLGIDCNGYIVHRVYKSNKVEYDIHNTCTILSKLLGMIVTRVSLIRLKDNAYGIILVRQQVDK
jgi:hypothetical protein